MPLQVIAITVATITWIALVLTVAPKPGIHLFHVKCWVRNLFLVTQRILKTFLLSETFFGKQDGKPGCTLAPPEVLWVATWRKWVAGKWGRGEGWEEHTDRVHQLLGDWQQCHISQVGGSLVKSRQSQNNLSTAPLEGKLSYTATTLPLVAV